MHVPLLDLKAQYDPIRDEVMSAIQSVVDSHRFILGPAVETLEHSIADLCGAKHAIGVSSGTDALLVALMALDIKAGKSIRQRHQVWSLFHHPKPCCVLTNTKPKGCHRHRRHPFENPCLRVEPHFLGSNLARWMHFHRCDFHSK